jgi:hypothetical protein
MEAMESNGQEENQDVDQDEEPVRIPEGWI